MSDATILTSSGLNVIAALTGALFGMTGVVVAIRARFVGHRAFALEHDLQESLGRLERRPHEQAAIEEAISRQELAVQHVRGYARRRQFFYRLLLGYTALMVLALTFVWLLFESNSGLSDLSLRWFWIGLAMAGLISAAVYVFVMRRETRLWSVAFSVEPLRIPSDRDAGSRSEADLESQMRVWLQSEGVSVQRAPAQSGFDLVGSRSGQQILVEVKAVPRLTLEDVDAVAGAAARLSRTEQAPGHTRVVIAVPGEAVKLSPSALGAARALEIEIYAINETGKIYEIG